MQSDQKSDNNQSASGAERLGDKQKRKRSFCSRIFFSSSEFLVFGRQF